MAIQSTSITSPQIVSSAAQASGAATVRQRDAAMAPSEISPDVAAREARAEARAAEAEANAAAAEESNKQGFDPEKLKEALDRAQSALPSQARDIAFSLHDGNDAVVVRIIDSKSDEVIRQIPSEEFLKIADALSEQIESIRAGLLLEQKA
ncbi:flagellar protein FlaG [Nitrogeniibacter aestuarii]|uniref:flagellar protein FlaG n=1 Tax=Nitrogeniibacter aestuarii TaxID=2815343 RepID=UPI001D114583|nr:flagellar protein FlaG [Nitrogeniibacter aestuarii]